jgi:hypothetical protein
MSTIETDGRLGSFHSRVDLQNYFTCHVVEWFLIKQAHVRTSTMSRIGCSILESGRAMYVFQRMVPWTYERFFKLT